MSQSQTDLIEIIADLVPESLRAEAWSACNGKNWYFGNRSSAEHSTPFWKMDLDGSPVFDAIWQIARPRCEELAGKTLRVVRQYANGHTYGLGGQPHRDDERPGCFTLLYYPMTEWKPEWQGETVFYDRSGEISRSVSPRPNRAVFFDARIPHAGRAPARICPELRVTVAFKLESVESETVPEVLAAVSNNPVTIVEVDREGPRCVYRVLAEAGHVSALLDERMRGLGRTLRLPGYRPGKIPIALLEARYGVRTRSAVIGQIGTQAAEHLLANGRLPVSVQVVSGTETGDVEFRFTVTQLPDLADADFEKWELERLTASEPFLAYTGVSAADANLFLAQDLYHKVLDHLDDAYRFPVAAPLVERELETIRKAAEAQMEGSEDRAAFLVELREIAERRVRLGAVIAELARRHRIAGSNNPAIEARVIEWLISRACVTERAATPEELRAMVE